MSMLFQMSFRICSVTDSNVELHNFDRTHFRSVFPSFHSFIIHNSVHDIMWIESHKVQDSLQVNSACSEVLCRERLKNKKVKISLLKKSISQFSILHKKTQFHPVSFIIMIWNAQYNKNKVVIKPNCCCQTKTLKKSN